MYPQVTVSKSVRSSAFRALMSRIYWHRIGDIYAERERGRDDMELLSVTMNDGVMQRSEIEGKDNSSEDKGNHKVVRKGDMVYNSMRMWQGANGASSGDVSAPPTLFSMGKGLLSVMSISQLFSRTITGSTSSERTHRG